MKLIAFFFFLSTFLSVHAQEYGLASYYADKYHGNGTASGEKYDKSKFTGAHNSLPFGTLVKVTRLDNNKSVVVRIIDRGPFTKGRVIDVSRAAAEAINLIVAGEARVRLDIVGQGDSNIPVANKENLTPKGVAPSEIVKQKETNTTTPTPATYSDASISKVQTSSTSKPAAPKKETTSTSKPVAKPSVSKVTATKKESSTTSSSTNVGTPKLVRGDFENSGLYKIQLLRPEKKGFGVQVASYTNYENALQKVSELQGKWFDDILLNIVPAKNGDTYQIILGQFPTEASASNYQKSLKSKYKINGFVVNLTTL